MNWTVEDLPSLVAWPAARGAPLEEPSDEVAKATVRACVQLFVVRLLSEALAAPESIPFTVESAMRLTLLEAMDDEAWLDLYASLDHAGMVELLDLPSELPAPVREALALAGAETVLDWLEKVSTAEAAPPGTVGAVVALLRVCRGLSALPPWHVRAVREAAGGYEVEARRLVGTAWPTILRIATPTPPPVVAGTVAFWDGHGQAVQVPPWLLRWDEGAASVRVFSGRESHHGLWRYTSPSSPDALEIGTVPPGMPPFLAEPTWATPVPGQPRLDPNAQTAMLLKPDPTRATTAMAERRASLPVPERQIDPPPADARLVLRVVVGPDLMQWMPLRTSDPIVLGRNHGNASFQLHHHQVSRAHTQVRITPDGQAFVKDLGSTNGTQVQGRTLASMEECELHPGETIAIGPVMLRLEWLGAAREARLEAIARLRDDEHRRDPLTLLLRPNHLIDELPAALHPSFREGGSAPGAPDLHGLLIYVDRLAAIHAQHGEKVADRVFRDVARVLQYEVESPGSWVRVGYGELLLPWLTDPGLAHAEGERLIAVIANHPWEPPIDRLTVTVAVAKKLPEHAASEWLRQLRRQLQDGRSRRGRGRVYTG